MTNNNIILEVNKILEKIARPNLNFYIKNHFPELYKEIIDKTNFLNKFKYKNNYPVSIFERLYCLEHNLTDRPKCRVCNKEYVRSFIVHENRYSEWCSISCSCKDEETIKKSKTTREKLYGDPNFNNNKKSKETRKEKYNGNYAPDDFYDKVKQTKLERHGDENYTNSEKRKQTCLKVYGYEYPTQNKDVQKQIKETKKKNYGDENFNNRPKAEQTSYKKFGVKHAMCLEEYQNKAQETCLKNNGVKNPLQLKSIWEKAKQTRFNKTGYDHPLQNKENLEKCIEGIKKRSWNFLITNENSIPMFTEDEYIKNRDKNFEWTWKCKHCGEFFKVKHYNGSLCKCPKCFPKLNGTSHLEKEIVDFIKSIYQGEIIENSKQIIKPLELDIYIPEKKLAIEFDGLYWHSEKCEIDKNYHLNKTELCEKQGIHLIHIFENEWISKQEIVKSRIKSILGCYNKVIYARKCQIKEISFNDTSIFLNQNHLFGESKSSINLGLFYKDELISVMTFSKTRFSKKYEYELLRFANKLGYHVIGAAGKLLKYFERNYKPKSIISYADRRWVSLLNNNLIYKKIGFKLEKIGRINYWYFKERDFLQSSFNFTNKNFKNLLENFDQNLSEYDNMINNGYFKIYDCGNYVFVKEY